MAGDININIKGPVLSVPNSKGKVIIGCQKQEKEKKDDTKGTIITTFQFYAYNNSDHPISLMFHGVRIHHPMDDSPYNRLTGQYDFEYLKSKGTTQFYSFENLTLRTLLGLPTYSHKEVTASLQVDVAFTDPVGKIYKQKIKLW